MNLNGLCPIISHEDSNGKNEKECIMDRCAWWDEEKGCCVVFSIYQGIRKITSSERYDLGDVYSEISSVSSELSDTNRKIDNLTK